jgi:NAD(P)H-flavin reductase
MVTDDSVRDYFIATAAVYVPCYAYTWLRTCFEHGFSQKAHVFVEDNGFTRITIPCKSAWKPGQHCFLRFTSFGIMQAISTHPFTICSVPSTQADRQPELVFYIRHQRGFTAKLHQHALKQPGIPVPVLVDGPYGGINLQKYYEADHVLVVAGGSGAGWCLPFIEIFARHRLIPADEEYGQEIRTDGNEGLRHFRRSGPLSLQVVLATRDSSSRVWFLRTVSELLSRCSAAESPSNIRISVYLTGEAAEEVDVPSSISSDPASSREPASATEKIALPVDEHRVTIPGKEFDGRPQLAQIVHEEATKVAEASQSLGVFVCGPDTMQNDVRNAVAKENLDIPRGSKAGGIYLHTEHFSWA